MNFFKWLKGQLICKPRHKVISKGIDGTIGKGKTNAIIFCEKCKNTWKEDVNKWYPWEIENSQRRK